MTDQNTANELRSENLRETFYEAINDGDWPVAREALSLLEDMHISTYELRREMNQAMAETDDITYEPYEEIIPLMTEHEKRMWAETIRYNRSSSLAFGMGDEALDQSRLSAEFGPNNA